MVIVVLIDSHVITHFGFTQIIKDVGPNVSGLALASVTELAAQAARLMPDVILLSVDTSENKCPMVAIRECRTIFPQSRVVFYDGECSPSYSTEWLKSDDVQGYLLKSESASVLLECIQVVLRGGKFISQEGCRKYLEADKDELTLAVKSLRTRESRIAGYLCEGRSTSWIAKKLERNPSTISITKKRIFQKLNVDNVIALARKLKTVGVVK